MKTLNLKLAHVLIKVSLALEWITLVIGIIGILATYFTGNTYPDIIDYLPAVDNDLNEITPTFWNTLPFYILLIVESAILISILKKSSEVVNEFREGLVFNSIIANKIKTIANWIVFLVIAKTALKFILQLVIFGLSELKIFSGLGTTILFTTLIYVAADVIKKGTDLKSENELTI